MRFFTLLFAFTLTLYASPKEFSTFNGKFVQTILDGNGKKIVYSGELWASKPQNALWVYHKPVKKSIYVNGPKITVIEPNIEQVTLRNLDGEIDFLQIVQKAVKVDAETYKATIKGETYTMTFQNNLLHIIRYNDSFDNKVVIQFSAQKANSPIDPSRFKASIPADYDIIQDR